MRTATWQTSLSLTACLAALALVPACGSDAGTPSAPTSTSTSTSTTSSAASVITTTAVPAPPTPQARTVKWVDLAVGDCLAAPPPTDPSVVTVTVVDCASPHSAEVYLLAPLAVNAAIADVADRECTSGLGPYSGQPAKGGPFSVTYLIDSNQDRTSNNPDPSTAICLLQAADGQPLTGPARR
jgi:hypothetical protein